MPVMSYLAYPVPGEIESLRRSLEAMPECEVRAADNADLLVLVTDTPSREADDELTRRLKELPSLAFLGLVAAYADDEETTHWSPESPEPPPDLPTDRPDPTRSQNR